MVSRELERLASDLAAVQHGVISRRQLYGLGFGRGRIDSWLATGRLLPLFRGVFAVGRALEDHRGPWMAGVLAAGTNGVLSGRSAAAAHGLTDPTRLVDVARSAGRKRRAQGNQPHEAWTLRIRRCELGESDVGRSGPIPVMTPSRTLVDLAGPLNHQSLRRVFLNAGRSGLLTSDCLDLIRARPAFSGRRRLIELVDHWTPGTGPIRSPLESEFLLLCGNYGIPAPRTNFRVGGYEADCFWPGTKIVAELDSLTYHDDGFGFEDDRAKGNALSLKGYTVLRFTGLMISERPAEVARIVRQHLGELERSQV